MTKSENPMSVSTDLAKVCARESSANLLEELTAIKARIRALFPDAPQNIMVQLRRDNSCEITMYGFPTYTDGSAALRALGIGERSKNVINDVPNPWVALVGRLDNDNAVHAFCNSLPPSCKIEIYTEQIPKKETVEVGGFIEVQRTRVVCGKTEAANESAPETAALDAFLIL